MPDRWSDYASLFVSALELGYPVHEIDRRWWEWREVFHGSMPMTRASQRSFRTWSRAVSFSPTPWGRRFEVLDQCNMASPPH
jgi:hypothetical protein